MVKERKRTMVKKRKIIMVKKRKITMVKKRKRNKKFSFLKDWDPKTFFAMHDLDGNGEWDENEVRILFRKELDKAYDPNNPEDDMKEREEEMERMREHVFK